MDRRGSNLEEGRRPAERIDEIGFGDLKLIQNPDQFCYGVDAVILADFAWRFCPKFEQGVDLGTGTGVIPFILSHKNPHARLTGIEIQAESVKLARRSCLLNGLEERVAFLHEDVKLLEERRPELAGSVQTVTCNPPYVARGGGIPNEGAAKFIARHETTATLADFIKTAAWLLSERGHFFLVHRPSRLVDILFYCRSYGLEPKDLRLVASRKGELPNILLLHCVAGGGSQLRLMEELCIYGEDGGYTEEIRRIYERVR